MISFSIPRNSADRLSRLGLACCSDNSLLDHIALRVGDSQVRFSATNGKLLASLLISSEDIIGSGDCILDREQFTTAMKTAVKHSGRIAFRIDDAEARITSGTTSSVVRRLVGTYPNVDHVWTKPVGRRWLPTMSSLDHQLTGIAHKIAGSKQPLLFSSPVEHGNRLERLWAVPGSQPDESLSLAALRSTVSAPAYWSDYELAVLVMPVSRGDAERQLDLSPHALSLPQVAALAA